MGFRSLTFRLIIDVGSQVIILTKSFLVRVFNGRWISLNKYWFYGQLLTRVGESEFGTLEFCSQLSNERKTLLIKGGSTFDNFLKITSQF